MVISDRQMQTSYLEQAQLTQVRRWIALPSLKQFNRSRLSGLLAEEFQIAVNGSVLASNASLAIDYLSSQEAIILIDESIREVTFPDNGLASSRVVVDCDLLNQSHISAALVVFEFAELPELMPVFRSVKVTLGAEKGPKKSAKGAVASRLLSVNHRWHTLVESPIKDAELFREIVADDFVMEFGHGAVRSFSELEAWVYGSASSVKAARHDLESFDWELIGKNRYQAVFVLNWLGLNSDEKRMSAKTKHTWLISDNEPAARFPQIHHINVEFVEAFRVLP